MAKARIKNVPHPDGSTRKALEMDFDTIREEWNEYQLSDGTTVRVKNTVAKILVLVDEDGNPILDEIGDPEVIVQGSINIATTMAAED